MATALGDHREVRLPIDKIDHAFGMMNKFDQLRVQKRGCDLLIKVEGKEIHVHRNVMMVGSDYFDAMFTHDTEEKQSGIVEIKDVSFKIFNKCVKFIYTGEISMVVKECEDLLFAASMLQLTSVCDNMSQFLKSRLKPSSFFATKRIADKYSLRNLRKACDAFALANLEKIVKEEEFDSLEKEYISFLITTKESTAPSSEDSKMAIILQWIKADVESRNRYLTDFLAFLNFQKISQGYARYLAKTEEICYSSSELMRMFLLSSTSGSSLEEKPTSISFGSQESSLIIFDLSAKSLKAYNPISQEWNEIQELHPDFNVGNSFTTVFVDEIIYVLIGNRKVFELDTQIKVSSWKSCPSTRKTHTYPSAQAHDGSVYIVGSSSMERYVVSDRKWEEIDCSEVANCHGCALAVHDDSIYTIGGYNSGELADVNRFSILSSSWSSMAPMANPRNYPAATSHEEKIYVAGGCHGSKILNDFLLFDPRANTWTQLSPMTKCRDYFSLCIVANQLYAVGNWNRACSIEKYSFEEKSWKVVVDEDDEMKIMAPATVAIELSGHVSPIL